MAKPWFNKKAGSEQLMDFKVELRLNNSEKYTARNGSRDINDLIFSYFKKGTNRYYPI